MYKPRICVVGLGYVGLPLSIELSKYFNVCGFDIKQSRIDNLRNFIDPNNEISPDDLKKSKIEFSDDPSIIKSAEFIIVAVPTPIDDHKNPDLTPLYKSSETVGANLQRGSIVVYESTVYPGVTEEKCVPILEQFSKLKWKEDFFVGYSPERINPGDKVNTVATIKKVISGDTEETTEKVAQVYEKAITAGVHRATTIKVAEAAKVIENTQRDINIALMNELRIIFDKMNISTKDVLEAAGTKWNFLKFEPGLVGGHCIGVDPYYLAYKAEELGHHPQIIMAGRRINDAMGRYFARELIKTMIHRKLKVMEGKVLILGITFKENVPDVRNSKVVDIIQELNDFGVQTDVWDPVAIASEVKQEYGVELITAPSPHEYEAVVLAVKHDKFVNDGINYNDYLVEKGYFYDIKQAM
ncbi:nucleotide sugar dehydrogenase [Chitinispirillales bacterium ANBcel5]|uniref:nucleotide sugar dehydrogenase n=1 Tax=Cellulosispirillum alkaliphilum TaxID=3039283 RepID=UPI002A509B9D|nr:nucleotide sugar dehydrogenase [Chitinispirillales bacterium ANBcel5]